MMARTSRFRAALGLLLALLLVDLAGDVADAQRRRRRRRPPPEPPPAQVETPAPAPDEDAPPAEVELAPEPPPPPDAPDPDAPPDLGALEADFATLMDELVQTRSRIAVLGNQLFRTKLRVRVENRADEQILGRLVIRVDGAPVFETGDDVGEDGRQVFEGFAAPGPHELTLEVEQRARAGGEYRYTLRDTFRFEVVGERLTEVILVLDDRSDIAEDFEDDGEGEYAVRTRVRVATRDLESEN
ncbi:MAG: hypothetical protein AAGH15_08400 [Myxococcota bacterium]